MGREEKMCVTRQAGGDCVGLSASPRLAIGRGTCASQLQLIEVNSERGGWRTDASTHLSPIVKGLLFIDSFASLF